MTAVAILAANNNTVMLDYLLRRRATVDPLDDGGVTPLYRAASRGSHTVCKTLVQHGANIAFRSKVRACVRCAWMRVCQHQPLERMILHALLWRV